MERTGRWRTQSRTETKTGYITVSTRPDFSLSASPVSRVVVVGRSTTYTVTVTATGGFSGPVGLSVSGLLPGISASFAPNSVAPGAAATLTVSTTSQAKPGSHALTITGTSTRAGWRPR
jgi:hypothetical protein